MLGWVFVGIAAAGLAAHWLDTDHRTLLVVASAAWLLAPASLLAVAAFLTGRHLVLAILPAVLVVAQVVAYGPLFVAETAPSGGDKVTVMTQNMLFGRADARAIVDRLRSSDIDVLALEELTPEAVDALYAAGIKQVMPYAWWRSAPGASGTGVWSRVPFSRPNAERGFSMFTISVELNLPTGQRVPFLAVHPAAPFPQDPLQWTLDFASLAQLLHDRLPPGPVIVAGDFNSTWDHARFRGLLTDGYRDAAEQAGAGLVRTWPADKYVPLIGIDHVLTRGAVAKEFSVITTKGSDHRGLMTTVVVPKSLARAQPMANVTVRTTAASSGPFSAAPRSEPGSTASVRARVADA